MTSGKMGNYMYYILFPMYLAKTTRGGTGARLIEGHCRPGTFHKGHINVIRPPGAVLQMAAIRIYRNKQT